MEKDSKWLSLRAPADVLGTEERQVQVTEDKQILESGGESRATADGRAPAPWEGVSIARPQRTWVLLGTAPSPTHSHLEEGR